MTAVKTPQLTPMDVASRMMRSHADPGLIAAYLKLELELDPTWAMSPVERLHAAVRAAVKETQKIVAAFAQHPAMKLALRMAAEHEKQQRQLAMIAHPSNRKDI